MLRANLRSYGETRTHSAQSVSQSVTDIVMCWAGLVQDQPKMPTETFGTKSFLWYADTVSITEILLLLILHSKYLSPSSFTPRLAPRSETGCRTSVSSCQSKRFRIPASIFRLVSFCYSWSPKVGVRVCSFPNIPPSQTNG